MSESEVWVETVEIEGGPTSPIGGEQLAELIRNRQRDISNAVETVSAIIRGSLVRVHDDDEWKLDAFEANVGVSLTAEAGAVIAKASSSGTIGVKLTYKRTSSTK